MVDRSHPPRPELYLYARTFQTIISWIIWWSIFFDTIHQWDLSGSLWWVYTTAIDVVLSVRISIWHPAGLLCIHACHPVMVQLTIGCFVLKPIFFRTLWVWYTLTPLPEYPWFVWFNCRDIFNYVSVRLSQPSFSNPPTVDFKMVSRWIFRWDYWMDHSIMMWYDIEMNLDCWWCHTLLSWWKVCAVWSPCEVHVFWTIFRRVFFPIGWAANNEMSIESDRDDLRYLLVCRIISSSVFTHH